MQKLHQFLRNLFCGSIALAVIASGRVRRAKKSVLNTHTVTAIYFHNPNQRLFARCVKWLSANGFTFISEDDLIQILHQNAQPPKGAVWLSFDDGFKELLQNVVPLSRQRKLPITIFLPSGIVEGHGLFPWLHRTQNENGAAAAIPQNVSRDAITVADVQKIASYPEVSIGSHTVGHQVTVNLSDEQARYEFGESKRALESWTGRMVRTFAYPEGRLSGHEGRALADFGYDLAATTQVALVGKEVNPYLVPRFHVGDNISFPEALCNMVGVWRPAIEPLQHAAQYARKVTKRLRRPSTYRIHRETSI